MKKSGIKLPSLFKADYYPLNELDESYIITGTYHFLTYLLLSSHVLNKPIRNVDG